MSSLSLFLNYLDASLTDVFIETGTSTGGGIISALEANFKEIISIEIDPSLANYHTQFCNLSNVKIIYGDSLEVLPEVLSNLNKRATFWLDSHISTNWLTTLSTKKGKVAIPLIEELQLIKEHYIKDHVILIDDINFIGKTSEDVNQAIPIEWSQLQLPLIEQLILSINPNYQIEYLDSRSAPLSILKAFIE